jgi:hypothetical protein
MVEALIRAAPPYFMIYSYQNPAYVLRCMFRTILLETISSSVRVTRVLGQTSEISVPLQSEISMQPKFIVAIALAAGIVALPTSSMIIHLTYNYCRI